MTERETLLAILVVLHVVEGAHWFQHGGIVLRRAWNGRFRRAPVGELVGNVRGGLAFLPPLPPFDEVFSGLPLPCALAPEGVVFTQTESLPGNPVPIGSGKTFAWNEVADIRADEKTVRIKDVVVWRADNVHAPLRLAVMLRNLAGASAAARPSAILAERKRRLDPDAVLKTATEFRKDIVWLQRLANVLFYYLLLIAPVVVWRFGWMPALWYLVPVLLLLTGSVGILLRRQHRRFYPKAGDERFKLTLLGWLAPLVGIRSVSLLSRPLLGDFHPLALVFAFAPETAPEIARGYWRDLRHPRTVSGPQDETALRIIDAHRAGQTEALKTLIEAQGLKIADLDKPPAPSDPANRRHCPRCESQFTETADACPECGGLKLVSL